MSAKTRFDLLSPASLWVPRHLCQSAWTEHAPFAFWLTDVLRPRRFVELGTHFGYSYFAFCQAIDALGIPTEAYAVDTWQGDEHAGFYDDSVYESVAAANGQYAAFSRLCRMTFAEAAAQFAPGTVDLLHIDGRHFYQDVREDFETWLPKLADDAIVLFHDTAVRERDFGVWRFFGELSAGRRSFQFLHGHGLGVVAVGEAPEVLAPLFAATGEEAELIRHVYASLGGSLASRRQLLAKTEAIDRLLARGGSLSVDDAEALFRLADWNPQVLRILAAIERFRNDALFDRKRANEACVRVAGLEREIATLKDELARVKATVTPRAAPT